MAIGFDNSNPVEKEKNDETQKCHFDLRIGVFFDGTGNNANNNDILDWFKLTSIVEKNHALNNTIRLDNKLKISNPAILSRLFTQKRDKVIEGKNNKIIHCYIEGAGANGFEAQNKIVDFLINGKAIRGLGFGLGSTGVVAKVSKAINLISSEIEGVVIDDNIIIDSIHFYVFGFSRGSTCARLFSYLVSRAANNDERPLRKSNNNRIITKDAEKEFKQYLRKKYFKEKVIFLKSEGLEKIANSIITVDFLGIYDTVSAIGFLKEENDEINKLRFGFMGDTDFWDNFHKDNSMCYGLYSPTLPTVISTCHICAMDEFRANFALTDIADAAYKDGNIELFLPGCHSDIGGGYKQDSKGEQKTLCCYYRDKQTVISSGNPMKGEFVCLSKQALEDTGWVSATNGDFVQINNKDTQSQTISFIHKPQPNHQWSNITLKFMYDRLESSIGRNIMAELFDKYPEEYPIDVKLKPIYDKLSTYIRQSGRFYYDIDSDKYAQLRKNYIHYTSTDKLHGPADPGNVPGRIIRDGKSIICRYVYYGYNPDNSKEDNEIHFMTDYNNITEIKGTI